MGITARELTKGTRVRFNGATRTVEHVAMHPAGVFVKWSEGGGNSLVGLLAFGAVIEA